MRDTIRHLAAALTVVTAVIAVVNWFVPSMGGVWLWVPFGIGAAVFLLCLPLKFYVYMDRRWVFLLMAIAVMIPVIWKLSFPEVPSPLVQAVFDKIESLPPGSKILMAFDYDPGSAPELQPMATAWTWHCAKRGHKLYFMTLWAPGPAMIQRTIDQVLRTDYRDKYEYGKNFINLGFRAGNEAVIINVASNIKTLFNTDQTGRSLNEFEMTRDIRNVGDFDLILNCSAGYPGTKEWVQYAATPLGVDIAGGCTGVQAPLLYPYIPNQMFGLLGAIKGAAEYEQAIINKYPEYGERAEHTQGIKRMGPQLIAHCLILALIILGNVILALQRHAREAV
jgi:hypothetical protein